MSASLLYERVAPRHPYSDQETARPPARPPDPRRGYVILENGKLALVLLWFYASGGVVVDDVANDFDCEH